MKCPVCGKENKEGANFCGQCGAPLKGTVIEETQELEETQERNGLDEPEEEEPPKKRGRGRKAAVIIAVLVLAVAAAGAGIWIWRGQKQEKEYRDQVASGDRYLEEMDYENAEAAYQAAISIQPKDPEPYRALIDLYLQQGEPDKAVETARQAQEAVPEEDREEFDEVVNKWENAETYTWAVEPEIQADDIYYVRDGNCEQSPDNERRGQFQDGYAVIQQGDALGIIGMDGVMKTSEAYETISAPGFYLMGRQDGGDTLTYDAFYDDTVHKGLVTGFLDACGTWFSWQGELHNTLEWSYLTMEEAEMPEEVIPVMEVDSEPDENAIGQWMEEQDGKYALFQNGSMVTDFIYDNCGSLSDGLIAVEQNGKWGYVNEEGETVIPLEFDASWNQFDEGISVTEAPEYQELCYGASGGYVVLVKDGEWELRTTDGKTAIPSGVFEAIRPVYKGQCWVKQDGKWGVITLENADTETEEREAEENKAEEENPAVLTAQDYQNAYQPFLQEAYADYGEYMYYALVDIDKNGVQELLVQNGTCEADYVYQVYTIQNGGSVFLGDIPGGHTMFYLDENGGTEPYIIQLQGHMSVQTISYISIENGQVSRTELYTEEIPADEGYYSNPYPVMMTDVTDASLLNRQ